jgi:hypothetical protein
MNRRLVSHVLGAMGVLKQSASPRFDAVVEDIIKYRRIHVHVDADHDAEWFRGVFLPLVHHSGGRMREVSMGIVTRIRVVDACYAAMWSAMKAVRDSRERIC